jgi:hypothetical protein
MIHRVLTHQVNKTGKCSKCGKTIEPPQHYWHRALSQRRRTYPMSVNTHEGCLLDAHGDPIPCPLKGEVLPVGKPNRYSTPTFPVQPLEIVEVEQQ